jgi:aspartyl-tRNA(Asn)/glutamyl-tRNA(Gln) amidotransferase subunit B
MAEWEAVIGLEVHVQLASATKAFSSSRIEFGAEPNSLTDPTVLGLPGALPVFNAKALELAVRLGIATGCTIRRTSRFARKHYFYPDLPKGYQISQFDEPLCEGGAIQLFLDDEPRSVRLTRIHLEEDAGKNTHLSGGASLVDLNRAGIPLCEVVSEPDIRSAAEAAEYMRALHKLVRFLDISEGNMEQGQLRCDANVSIRPRGQVELGTRAELKNINSFKFVEKAIEHEIARQIRIVEDGGKIVQETRLWDSDAGLSKSMRSKEEAEDYRYFPDPDLPPLVVSDQYIADIEGSLPELPAAMHARMVDTLGLSHDDARTLTADRELAMYFDAALAAYGQEAGAKPTAGAKPIANWIQAELLRELNRGDASLAECKVGPAQLAALVQLIEDGTISGKIAKQVFAEMLASGADAAAVVKDKGLEQITDSGAIEAIVADIIDANPAQAEQYRAGKQSLLGFFVGQVMKKTGGKANPKMVNEVLRRLLG